MIKYILLLIISLNVNAATSLSWSPSGGKDYGYKIYWSMVKSCDEIINNDFIYSIDVGEVLEYNFSEDPNFQIGKKYLFRLVSYNIEGQESNQSDEFLCVEIKPPQAPRDLKKK